MGKTKKFNKVPKGYIATWPYNLLEDIFEKEISAEISDDQMNGLMTAISYLPEKTQVIIVGVYKNGDPLRKLSADLNISTERVRQLRIRGVMKLRAPRCKAIIADGVEGSAAISQELFYISQKRRELLEAKTELIALEGMAEDSAGLKYAKQYVMPFYEVLDWKLSVRSTNCLLRSNINTIADIQKAFQDGSIDKIRNLGPISIAEIKNYMSQAGYAV